MNKLVDNKNLTQELDKLYNKICCVKQELQDCSVTENCLANKYVGPGSQVLSYNGTTFSFVDVGASTAYPVVNTYADLPLPNTVSPPNNVYLVTTSTGTWPFNRKERGLWYSDGIIWSRLGDVTPIFVDDVFQIRDNIDVSKTLQFNVDLLTGPSLKYFQAGTGTIAELSDIPTDYISTNQSSLFQQTSLMSNYLDINYTSHTHSQYINTSNSTLFQSTGPYLTTQKEQAFSGIGGSSTFETLVFNNGNGLSFSNNAGSVIGSYTVPTDYISIGQSSLFRHTSNDSQLQFTSQMSNYQLTSDNTLSLGTNYTTHTHSQYINTNQSSLFEFSSHTTVFLTTAMESNAGSRFVNTSAGLNLTNISATFNSNSISLSVANPVTTNGLISRINLSAGTTSNNLSALTFSDSNGISFGLNGSVITATVKTDYQSSNANYLTSQSNQAFSAANGSSTFQTLSFQDSNGISFSNNGGAIRVSHDLQYTSNTSLITSNALNTNQSSVFVLTANSSLLQHTSATSNITSNALHSSASRVINILAATNNTGGGTASLSSNVSFSNANGLSFYTSAGNAIVGSYTVPTQTQQPMYFSLSNSNTSANTMVFGNLNGVSWSYSNGSIVGSVQTNYLTTARASTDAVGLNTAQSNVTWTVNSSGISLDNRGYAGTNTTFNGANISGSITLNSVGLNLSLSAALGGGAGDGYNIIGVNGGATQLSTTLQLSNSNNISFGLNAGTITASASFSQSNPNITFRASGLTTANSSTVLNASQILFNVTNTGAGVDNIYLGYSNGSILLEYNNPNILEIGAGANTLETGLIQFINSNGISFGMDGAGDITASYTVPTQSNQNISLYALGNTTQNSSTVLNASNLSFNGLGNISVGFSNGSIQLSQTGGGGGLSNINLSAGTTSNNLSNFVFSNSNNISFGLNGSTVTASFNPINIGISTNGNTAGTTGTFDGGDLQYIFVGGNNITLSQSSNANSVTLSIHGRGGATLSEFAPYADREFIAGQIGQGTLEIDPEVFPNMTMDRVLIPIFNSNSSNSSGSHTLSFWIGLYTRNASTLSLFTSGSQSYAITHSGTAGSYSLYSGIRHASIPLNTSLSEGRYWIAFLSRTTSGGANGTYSNMILSNLASNFLGHFGSSHNTSMQFLYGQGIYSATTSAMPSSIAFSQLNGSGSANLRSPVMKFVNSTI